MSCWRPTPREPRTWLNVGLDENLMITVRSCSRVEKNDSAVVLKIRCGYHNGVKSLTNTKGLNVDDSLDGFAAISAAVDVYGDQRMLVGADSASKHAGRDSGGLAGPDPGVSVCRRVADAHQEGHGCRAALHQPQPGRDVAFVYLVVAAVDVDGGEDPCSIPSLLRD